MIYKPDEFDCMRGTGWVKYKQTVSEGSSRLSIWLPLVTFLLRWLLVISVLRWGSWGNVGGLLLFGRWLGHDLIYWWVDNLDGVGERSSWAGLAFGIPTFHTRDHESEGAKPGGGGSRE